MRRYSAIDPKRPIISDMPKGSGYRISATESYIINAEILQNELKRLSETLKIKWLIFLNNYGEKNLSVKERKLLKLRFVQGKKWKICAIQMNILYPNEEWNDNKVYRIYRNIMKKIGQSDI